MDTTYKLEICMHTVRQTIFGETLLMISLPVAETINSSTTQVSLITPPLPDHSPSIKPSARTDSEVDGVRYIATLVVDNVSIPGGKL